MNESTFIKRLNNGKYKTLNGAKIALGKVNENATKKRRLLNEAITFFDKQAINVPKRSKMEQKSSQPRTITQRIEFATNVYDAFKRESITSGKSIQELCDDVVKYDDIVKIMEPNNE